MSNNLAKQSIGMYDQTITWNPFKGCLFDCIYCEPSFKRQAKRQKHNCLDCYKYVPHYHPERLKKIPSSPRVFVCGNADISFCDPKITREIIRCIKGRRSIFYFQSKRPEYFTQFLDEFPNNVILLTTLETNRDKDYGKISKAPLPSIRYQQFKSLNWPKTALTIEPVMDFDFDIFSDWITTLNLEHLWLGYNSKPKSVTLPEPSKEKFVRLYDYLISSGIEVRLKDARNYLFQNNSV